MAVRRVWLDDVARDAATSRLPRRAILGRLSYGAAAAGVAGLVGADRASAAPATKCPPGLTNCGGVCRVTSIDPDHCGTCGTVCETNEICRGGVCTQLSTCPAGQTKCGTVCVDLQTDATNCGRCGQVCASGTCSAGICGTPVGGCTTCADCGNQACIDGSCGACTTDSQCCSPLVCVSGVCDLVLPP